MPSPFDATFPDAVASVTSPRPRLHRAARWLGSVALIALAVGTVAASAVAQPSGPAASPGTTVTLGSTTTVDQSTPKAVINWKSFDIGSAESVEFKQPNAQSIALNRISTSGKSTKIDGSLLANGQVWIVNPNGVLFGGTAKVNANSLVATTTDIPDADFDKGTFAFSQTTCNCTASVVNDGVITVGATGFVVLAAKEVRNQGVIEGKTGTIVLAGVPTFTLDLNGDNLIRFVAAGSDAQNLARTQGHIENSGELHTDGGTILLTTEAADRVVNGVINTTGLIEARGAGIDGGHIVFHGGPAGKVTIAGLVDAGAGAGGKGGGIDIDGRYLTIADGALITTAGGRGGGDILLGDDATGSSPTWQIIVAPGARLVADANTTGDGGAVTMQSHGDLVFAGSASTRGGAGGGNGGSVETTGLQRVLVTGTVDASAAHGEDGDWLIKHPSYATIDDGVVYDPASGGQSNYPAKSATIAAGSLNNSPADVTVRAATEIDVNGAVNSTHDIALASRTIVISAPLQTTQNVLLDAKYASTENGAEIAAQGLDIGSAAPANHVTGGTVTLDTDVRTLSVGRSEPDSRPFHVVTIHNKGDLVIGTIENSGVEANAVDLRTDGELKVGEQIKATGSGDALVVVTDRFVNDSGPDALQTPNGRAIVYSQNPSLDMRGGLAGQVLSGSIETTPPQDIGVPGNVFVYRVNPTTPPATTPSPPPTTTPIPPPSSPPPVVTTPPLSAPHEPLTIPVLAADEPIPPELRSLIVTQIAETSAALPQVGQSSSAATASVPPEPPSLVNISPPSNDSASQDLLFANDGNQELWGVTSVY